MGAILPAGDALGAVPEGPTIDATFTIANESWMDGWFDAADDDVIVVNAGGIVHCAWNWSGADGSRAIAGISVNLGGQFILHNGTTLTIADTTAITIAEGARFEGRGTSGSRCGIVGENKATTWHNILLNRGGKFYADYTDISKFYYGVMNNFGYFELHNGTISDVNRQALGSTDVGTFYCTNSVMTSAGLLTTGPVMGGTSCENLYATLINCTMSSQTDNRLAIAVYFAQVTFVDCTYKGNPIASDDLGITTQDIDVRIYEASVLTSDVSTASWALRHDEMDSTGMITTPAYTRVPGYLAYGQGSPSKIYTLNWTGYWPSGTSVANRVYYTYNYSNGAAPESGTNGKWNITASDWGHYTNSVEVWSGTNAAINLMAIVIPATVPPGLDADSYMLTYEDAAHTIPKANFTWGDDVYFTYLLEATAAMLGDYTNFTVATTGWATVLWISNTTLDYGAGIPEGGAFTFATTTLTNATYYILATIEHPDIATTSIVTQFSIVDPGTSGTGSGDFAAAANIVAYSDAATTIPCNNFTFNADVVINGTITTNGNLTNASVIIGLYNSTGFMSELLNVTWNFTASIEYNITEINGGIILFWQANASGQYHILLNITNATAFYNTTVTTEGFWVRPQAAAASTTIIKPMVNYDLTPIIRLVEESAGNILTGFILFIVLLLIGISWRVSQKRGPTKWSVGPVTLRYSPKNRR